MNSNLELDDEIENPARNDYNIYIEIYNLHTITILSWNK